jgi:quercetin dioxygenase-like cupin family protein
MPLMEPWIEWFPGIGLKMLRATQETGHWTILVNCSKGSSIPRHEHLGAGEYYIISGKMEVRGGVENGGITAITGDYGYEPNGVIHDMTNSPRTPSCILQTLAQSGSSTTITIRSVYWIGRAFRRWRKKARPNSPRERE